MRVLFVCYPSVGLSKGGLYHQINNTKLHLERLGVEVVYHNFMMTSLDTIDVCHVFSLHSSSHNVIESCLAKKIPVVLSPVYNRSCSQSRIKLEAFLSKAIPGFLGELKSVYRVISKVNIIFALNEREEDLLAKTFALPSDQLVTIVNGVDERMKLESETFSDENYVLSVGVVDENKNHIKLIEAALGENWQLHIVGPLKDNAYVRKCKQMAESANNIFLHGEMPYASDALIECYERAKVFCLPSFKEVQPLTLIEAAGYNCNIVTSKAIPLPSYLKDSAFNFDPMDSQQIRNAIREALITPSNSWRSLAGQPSWLTVAGQIKFHYENLLNNDE